MSFNLPPAQTSTLSSVMALLGRAERACRALATRSTSGLDVYAAWHLHATHVWFARQALSDADGHEDLDAESVAPAGDDDPVVLLRQAWAELDSLGYDRGADPDGLLLEAHFWLGDVLAMVCARHG